MLLTVGVLRNVVDCRGTKEGINKLCGGNFDILFYKKKINFLPKKLLHVSTRLGHHQVHADSLHLHKFLNPYDNKSHRKNQQDATV